MSADPSPIGRTIRRDGWTVERQLTFLGALAESRCTSYAARAAGMSRSSAYRLRDREANALFAALWDQALWLVPPPLREGDIGSLSNGRLMRLLGHYYRRNSTPYADQP